jgi:hypothetical protein
MKHYYLLKALESLQQLEALGLLLDLNDIRSVFFLKDNYFLTQLGHHP